jgi:leader peptidase (prepilin peptidase)/N-methyltransferase
MEVLANLFAAAGSIYILAVMCPLVRIDIREHRLPNVLVLPAFPITLIGQVIGCWILFEWQRVAFSISASIVAFLIGLVANRFASLGMGDVKLIAAAAMALGWYSPVSPVLFVFLGFVIASAVVLMMLLMQKTTLSNSIALGPYLLAGFAVTQILTWSTYFGGFTPYFFM